MRLCFVQASGQNAFFGELLDALRGAAERQGVATETAVDHFPPLGDGLVYVFVPHEYVPLTLEGAHPSPGQLRRTVVISSEQPGTTWFEQTAGFSHMAGGMLDINAIGLAELARRGVPARRLQLGYVPEWDMWGGDEDSKRPIDVAFLGGHLPRRAKALAECGRILVRRRTALRLVENVVPHTSDSARFLSGREKWQHLASARTLLNIHRNEGGYFEWQRVVEAITNGCVVVSEHSVGFPPLIPGEHFVSTSTESLPFLLDALLDSEDLLRRVRRSAYDFLRSELPLDAGVEALLDAAEDVSRARTSRRGVTPPQQPLPRPAALPPPEWMLLAGPPSDAQVARMALKRLILTQHELEKRIGNDDGEPFRKTEIQEFGAVLTARPRVSVVVSLHDYEAYIEDALRSVALSDYPSLELVVVDDASTDRSADVAARALASYSWLPSKLVRLPRNEGLPAARNAGLEYSIGELVFILDADNAVYPHAFERLVAALDEDPDAAFAYGILEEFDATGSVGLMSWMDWSPSRLARGNYIDAAALVRRATLEDAGGYSTDKRLYGWEDFDLWCSLADRGLRGAFVPEILVRYRRSRSSMIAVTNIDTSEAWAALLERHPFLEKEATVANG